MNEAVNEARGDEAEVRRLGEEIRDRLHQYLVNIEDHFSHGRTDQARYLQPIQHALDRLHQYLVNIEDHFSHSRTDQVRYVHSPPSRQLTGNHGYRYQ